MKKVFLFTVCALALAGCSKNDFAFTPATPDGSDNKGEIQENVQQVFGVTFDPEHNWCTTTSGSVTITGIPSGASKVQLYALISKDVTDDEGNAATETSLLKLNEDANVSGSQVTLVYDAPSNSKSIYAAVEYNGKRLMKLVNNNSANFATTASARSFRAQEETDFSSLTLTEEVESFANYKYHWLPGQMLYGMSEEAYQTWKKPATGYSEEFTQLFRDIVFSYFKNGRQYNNLPLIWESQYVNDRVYPVTTGTHEIVVSPVYKSDQAERWGNEVYNSDLYYYYFKQKDLDTYVNNGGNAKDFLNALPKFKAIPFNQHFGVKEDDVIEKRYSYTLVYWGEGTPEVGKTTGKPFPAGYKIGFMVRAKATTENGKKQGELYGDGRLNNEINNYSGCNFQSSVKCASEMAVDGPRAGWINVEDRLFVSFESGTDADFNDVILEVEGGIEPIMNIPEFENDAYTFCFEDRDLGDYDMNDIVIKATRIDKNHVEYSIVACGAWDELQVKNIKGTKINELDEVHEMFGVGAHTFINTVMGEKYYEPIKETVTVKESFSFLDAATQPYIFNKTTNKAITLSKMGEDPHGIMIPFDFKYPKEKTCIKDAYGRFNEWGQSRVTSTDWYKYWTQGLVYITE